MSRLLILLVTIFFISISGTFAQTQTDSVKVHGNCGMCKKRIEKAAMVDGVESAVWNKTTQMVTVVFDADKTNTTSIQQKIAAVGHDTEKFTAPDKVYDKLPMCCLYERKGKPGSGKSQPHK